MRGSKHWEMSSHVGIPQQISIFGFIFTLFQCEIVSNFLEIFCWLCLTRWAQIQAQTMIRQFKTFSITRLSFFKVFYQLRGTNSS